jgi:hypothetical protein
MEYDNLIHMTRVDELEKARGDTRSMTSAFSTPLEMNNNPSSTALSKAFQSECIPSASEALCAELGTNNNTIITPALEVTWAAMDIPMESNNDTSTPALESSHDERSNSNAITTTSSSSRDVEKNDTGDVEMNSTGDDVKVVHEPSNTSKTSITLASKVLHGMASAASATNQGSVVECYWLETLIVEIGG